MPLPANESYGPEYGTALKEVPTPFAGVVFPSLSNELTSEERTWVTEYHALYMQGGTLTPVQQQRAVHLAEEALALFQKHLTWCRRLPEGEQGGEYQHTLANVRWVQALLGVPAEGGSPTASPVPAPTVAELKAALLPDIAEIVARVMAEMKQSEAKDKK
jgi:hypothetical protein